MATATFLQERRWPCGHCRISVTTAQGPPLNNCDRWYKFTHCPFGQIPNFCGIIIVQATIGIKNILIPLTNSDATSRCSRKKLGIRSTMALYGHVPENFRKNHVAIYNHCRIFAITAKDPPYNNFMATTAAGRKIRIRSTLRGPVRPSHNFSEYHDGLYSRMAAAEFQR